MIEREEFEQRRERLRSELAAKKLNAALISSMPNVRYFSGFTGSNGMLLIANGRATLFTDPRYTLQAREEAGCTTRIVRGPLTDGIARHLRGIRRLGFEDGRLTVAAHDALRAKLPLGASLEPVHGLLEQMRMIKSAGEVALIRRSVEASSAAFSRAMHRARPGVTESDLAAEIEFQMRKLGAEGPAFESIVAAGARTALPHARPTAAKTLANGLLLVDVGAFRAGYASDMTRMAHFGMPSGKIRRMYGAVLEAQQAALDAVRPGVHCAQVDHAARKVLRKWGLEKEFVHSTGHGLGLEIHEPPRIGKKEKTRLEAGMVVTIEPGAYVGGFGGVRIEDTVLVTANGCEVLTPTPKELMVL